MYLDKTNDSDEATTVVMATVRIVVDVDVSDGIVKWRWIFAESCNLFFSTTCEALFDLSVVVAMEC